VIYYRYIAFDPLILLFNDYSGFVPVIKRLGLEADCSPVCIARLRMGRAVPLLPSSCGPFYPHLIPQN